MSKHRIEQLENSFRDVADFVSSQFITPLGQVSFWVFLILGIIGAGGYGVWVELYRFCNSTDSNVSGVIQSIFTYYPALAGAAIFQLIFHHEKHVRSASTFVGVLVFLITFIFFPSPGSSKTGSLVGGVILAFLSVMIWWIANGKDGTFHDNPPNSSTGGNVAAKLPGTGVLNKG